MAYTETQQITELIKKSHHILIAFPKNFSVDAVASALALNLVLKKMGKLVDVVASDFVLPKNLSFLPNTDTITQNISGLQKFIITLRATKDQIEEFTYSVENDQLKIFITPKHGSFKKEDVNAGTSDYRYDLIFTLDTTDLESIGPLYQNFADFFYNTPVINIDHHTENEQYGQVNLTNLTAVATSEVLYHLFTEIDPGLIDKDVATCLLTGLVAKTQSFKTPNVTPKTLEIASALMTTGADRDAVVKSLYRSRSLSTLNLWGRVLARLKNSDGNKLVWSLLTEHDFIEARADQHDLPDVVDELITFIPGVEVAVLINQLGEKIGVYVRALKGHNALHLAGPFNPEGSRHVARFQLEGKTLPEAEKEVISQIRERLGQSV